MSEADPICNSLVSLEVTPKDLFKVEGCTTVSDISEEGAQNARKKDKLDCVLYKGDHPFEPLFEDFAYDFDDASEKLMSPLSTLKTCPVNKDLFFATELKECSEGLLAQGELVQQCRMLDQPKEICKMEENASEKAPWELRTEAAMLAKELLVDKLDLLPQKRGAQDPPVIMGESLLDCIVKESPIKEVSSFLTLPTGSLFKTDVCLADEDLLIKDKWNDLNMTEKTSNHEENMMDTGQRIESTAEFRDNMLTVSPDALDENLDYIRTLMKSNRHLKKHLKSNLAHYSNQKEVAGSTSPSQSTEIVSKGEHTVEEKSLSLCSEKAFILAEQCRQGDTGDKGIIFPPHTTRSCYLSPYETSLKLCERNPSGLSSKLQEGDMDFSKVIKDLEQDQQKQLTHIVDLQYGNIFFERKIKEMEKLLLQEGDMDFNKAIQQLEKDQRKHQTQIMDLYYDNVSLETKIKELEVDILRQHAFNDAIDKLKKNIADLTEANNKVTKEKNEAERCLKTMQDVLDSTKGHLHDFGVERSTLMLQLEKLSADFSTLQEKYQAQVEQKEKYMNQCAELSGILHTKEQEIKELSCLKDKLELEFGAATSALHKMREEMDATAKDLLSSQTELQRQKDERVAEKEELACKYKKLVAQIKILQEESENEQTETEKMQQQICVFKMENSELLQQITQEKDQNHSLRLESSRWKEQFEQIRESQTLKEQMHCQMIQVLRRKIELQQEELRKKEEIIEWRMHILGRFLLDMKSMHSDLSIRSLHSEEDHFNSPYVQKASHLLSKIRSLLALTEGLLTCQDMNNQTVAEWSQKSELKEKMTSISLKKKTLEKKLQKHKENIAAMWELIANAISPEDYGIMVTGASQEESGCSTDPSHLCRAKLGGHHKQSDECEPGNDIPKDF